MSDKPCIIKIFNYNEENITFELPEEAYVDIWSYTTDKNIVDTITIGIQSASGIKITEEEAE